MSLERRPRVLLADDFPDLLTAIGGLLAEDCQVVGSVDDGGALLEAAARLQPDVIVLDLNIPTVDRAWRPAGRSQRRIHTSKSF